jgi:hypothetical protein
VADLDIPADQVRQLREETGVGMMEIRKVLRGEQLLDRINSAESLADLKVVLIAIVADHYPTRPPQWPT